MNKIRNDIILIIGLFILAIGLLISFYACSQKDNLCAYVYHDNEVVLTINFEELNEEKTYIVNGEIGEVIIAADKDGVWIVDAGCEDEVCINQGKISNSAQTITCLPNKIVIKLIGKGVDIVV